MKNFYSPVDLLIYGHLTGVDSMSGICLLFLLIIFQKNFQFQRTATGEHKLLRGGGGTTGTDPNKKLLRILLSDTVATQNKKGCNKRR